ncbi:MAG: hypothetical protein HY513_01410 [Candidatus Aenigmarchaeota archaeon]|nr:hypothetical protein [Candidatus Aenigmarchaeota archaeon]
MDQKIHIYAMALAVVLVFGLLVFENSFSINLTGEARRGSGTSPPDITNKLVFVGNPSAQQYPGNSTGIMGNATARSVWDMKAFEGRIYLGQGTPELGGHIGTYVSPIAVWAYEPSTKSFIKESELFTEAIVLYKTVSGVLTVPGAHHRVWDSYVFRKAGDSWEQSGSITNTEMLFDVDESGSLLFSAGMPISGGGVSPVKNSEIFCCSNWIGVTPFHPPKGVDGGLAFAYFKLNNSFYVQTMIGSKEGVYIYKADSAQFEKITGAAMANKGGRYYFRMIPPVVYFKDKILYSVSYATYASAKRSAPIGVWIASTPFDSKKAGLPSGETPWDILKITDSSGIEKILVLTSTYDSTTGAFKNKVYSTADLAGWKPVLQFTSPSVVYSFERFNGDVYFGYGVYGIGAANSGEIWKLASADVPAL